MSEHELLYRAGSHMEAAAGAGDVDSGREMSEISDATAIFAQRRCADGTSTSDWWVIVQHLGEERIYATCPYKQYANDIVKGLRIQAGMNP